LDTKIDSDVVIPQTVLNFGEYQAKLQRLAIYADQGLHKEMQEVLDDHSVMNKKNQLLQPLFRDLKSQIRHMSYTPEHQLMQEYLTARNQIKASMVTEG